MVHMSSQRTTFSGQFASTVWFRGLELRSSCLQGKLLTGCAMPQIPVGIVFLLFYATGPSGTQDLHARLAPCLYTLSLWRMLTAEHGGMLL